MGFRSLPLCAAVVAASLAAACASDGPPSDPSTEQQVRSRIEALATLRGADLEANIRILGQFMRGTSVPLLIRSLEGDSDPKVRAGCAQALGMAQDGRAVEPLARALSDSNDGVRFTAAYNLGLFRDARGLPTLFESLRSRDPLQRRSGDQALRSLTGMDFGYDPMAEPPEREAAADRWEAWFREVGESEAGSRLLPTEGAIRR